MVTGGGGRDGKTRGRQKKDNTRVIPHGRGVVAGRTKRKTITSSYGGWGTRQTILSVTGWIRGIKVRGRGTPDSLHWRTFRVETRPPANDRIVGPARSWNLRSGVAPRTSGPWARREDVPPPSEALTGSCTPSPKDWQKHDTGQVLRVSKVFSIKVTGSDCFWVLIFGRSTDVDVRHFLFLTNYLRSLREPLYILLPWAIMILFYGSKREKSFLRLK